MTSERIDAIICGRKIGTAEGWDQIDTNFIVLYEFKPADGVGIPTGDLAIDYDGGRLEITDDDGKVTFEADMLAAVAGLPREDMA